MSIFKNSLLPLFMSTILLIPSISSAFVSKTTLDSYDNNAVLTNNKILDENYDVKSLQFNQINKNLQHRTFISRYPKSTGWLDGQSGKEKPVNNSYTYQKEISKGDRVKMWGLTFSILNIDTKNYSSGKNDFIWKYPNTDIEYCYGWNITNNGHSGWQNGLSGQDVGVPNCVTKPIKTSNTGTEDDNLTTLLRKEYKHTTSSSHVIEILQWNEWSGNNLEMKISVKASLNYNKGSTYKHAVYVGYKPLTIEFY